VAEGVAGFTEILLNVLGIRDSVLLLCFSLVSKPKNFAMCCSVLQCVAGCALFFRDRKHIREPTLSACKQANAFTELGTHVWVGVFAGNRVSYLSLCARG